jgi:hypothetical protein
VKHEVLIGQTDYTVLVKIRDTAGAAATGLDEADIDIAYARVETDNDVTTADVTPAALTALTDAHTDWGFEEVSATDHPGVYRLDIADAVFASGAWSAVVTVTGTGLDPADLEFVLVAFNPRDGVRLGLTALPNAAADGAGGLPISDAGGLDLDAKVGALTFTVAGKVDANTTHLDDTDLSADGPIPLLGIIDKGTAQAATGTTLQLRAGASFGDSELVGASFMVLGSTQGRWQTRDATANTGATDTVTVDDFTTTPTGTITYIGFGGPPAPVTPPDVNVKRVSDDATAADTLELFAEALDQATGQLDSGSLAAGTITAASIATGAIDADALAADAGTELGTAVWASATRTLTSLAGLTVDTVTTLTNLPAITANWLTAAGIAADAGAEIADAVWEEAIADHEGTVGSVAEALATAGGSGASAADIADAVWEEAIADHEGTVGSVAEALATAGGSGASAADIADAVWDEALAGHAAAGSAGAALSDVPTTAEFEARTIAAASYFDPAVDKVFLGDGAHGGTSAGLTLENVRVAPTSDKEAVKITGYSGGTTSAYRIIAGGKNGILVNATGDDAVHLETSEANSAGLNLVGGASSGGMAGSVIGNITGNLTGNITGNITGDFTGNLSTSLAVLEADTPGRVTKNTALAAFPFKMVLSSDHATAATGLTVTATRSLDGAAFAACANAVSEISNGWYKIDLAAADLNANTVALRFSAATADTVDATIVTQPT